MKRNGKTAAGTQRYRCGACGTSVIVFYDDTPMRLQELLSWLLSKETQVFMSRQSKIFRRRAKEF